ncbi:hypothetical protein [Microbacterium sp. HJ5]
MRSKPLARTLMGTVLVAAFASSLLAAPAYAVEESPLEPEFVAEVTSKWTQYGVTPEQQDALLDKLSAGMPVDAMMDTAVPVSTETHEDRDSLDTVKRYEDGSISVFEVEKPKVKATDGPTTMVVEGCTKSGTRWTGCSANGWYTAVTLAFKVSMDVGNPNLGRPAYLISYNTPTFKCMVTSCTYPVFELIRTTQSGSLPAMVNLATTWSNIFGSGTTRLSLQVKNGTANTY